MDLIYRFEPHHPVTLSRDLTPDDAAELMEQGNGRFVSMVNMLQKTVSGEISGQSIVVPVCPISIGLPIIPGLVPTQSPFALVVGCSDARVPTETIFDQFSNGLFVIRVAGNALGTEGLGSIHFAVRNLADSLRMALVLGHTGCGAITAAVDAYLNPQDYMEIGFSYSLRALLDRVMMGVRGADRAIKMCISTSRLSLERRRSLLIECAIYLNAAITSYHLRQEARQLGNTDLRVCYGVYDLADGHVRSAPKAAFAGCDTTTTFAEPPADIEGFTQLAHDWATHLLVGS